MTYNGKLYGLPYYADTISFIYNKKILEDAGIAVPTTWEEVTAAAEKLKAGGMEHPIVYEFDQELPNFFDAFVAPGPTAAAAISSTPTRRRSSTTRTTPPTSSSNGWPDAFKKDLVQQETHESKVIPSMNTGKHAFTIVYNYVLAAMNNAAEQPLAGQFALAPMPGEAHATLGFTKFYSITAQAAQDPARAEAAWKFVNFMAGKPYKVAKRWAVEKGLGFGQLLALRRSRRAGLLEQVDRLRRRSSSRWRPPAAAPGPNGRRVWAAYFRPLLAQAMVGEATVDEVMKAGAAKWNEFRDKMAKN